MKRILSSPYGAEVTSPYWWAACATHAVQAGPPHAPRRPSSRLPVRTWPERRSALAPSHAAGTTTSRATATSWPPCSTRTRARRATCRTPRPAASTATWVSDTSLPALQRRRRLARMHLRTCNAGMVPHRWSAPAPAGYFTWSTVPKSYAATFDNIPFSKTNAQKNSVRGTTKASSWHCTGVGMHTRVPRGACRSPILLRSAAWDNALPPCMLPRR